MEKYIYLCDLYDYYKELFTDKQRNYFEYYYFDNLSLSEIAENENVSRNAIHNQLKIMEEKLIEYEEKLKLLDRKEKILKLIDKKVEEEIYEKIKEYL